MPAEVDALFGGVFDGGNVILRRCIGGAGVVDRRGGDPAYGAENDRRGSDVERLSEPEIDNERCRIFSPSSTIFVPVFRDRTRGNPGVSLGEERGEDPSFGELERKNRKIRFGVAGGSSAFRVGAGEVSVLFGGGGEMERCRSKSGAPEP